MLRRETTLSAAWLRDLATPRHSAFREASGAEIFPRTANGMSPEDLSPERPGPSAGHWGKQGPPGKARAAGDSILTQRIWPWAHLVGDPVAKGVWLVQTQAGWPPGKAGRGTWLQASASQHAQGCGRLHPWAQAPAPLLAARRAPWPCAGRELAHVPLPAASTWGLPLPRSVLARVSSAVVLSAQTCRHGLGAWQTL